MGGFWNALTGFLLRLLLSPWFWLAVGLAVLPAAARALWRRLKLRALSRVGYRRSVSVTGVFAGEELELTEQIRNYTWFPLFSVRVEFFLPAGLTVDGQPCTEGETVTSIFFIPPLSTVQKRHTVRADRRDRYLLQTARIVYHKNEFVFSDTVEFFAYPDIRRMRVEPSDELCQAGNVLAERKYLEDPLFVSGIRPYHSGAPLRSVNFKASARALAGGVPCYVCNSYDSSRNDDAMIFLDLFTYAGTALGEEELVEHGLSYACYLFCEALRSGAEVGFAANCARDALRYVSIPCGSGDLHTRRVLEAFACINRYARRDFAISAMLQRIVPTLRTDTDVFVITTRVDDELAKTLAALRRMGYRLRPIRLEETAP